MRKVQLPIWAQCCVKLLILSLCGGMGSIPLLVDASITSCTATTVGISFGQYTGVTNNTNGSISLRCNYTGTSNSLYILLGPTVFSPFRIMSNGSTTLNYNIYTSGAHTIIWANGNDGSQVVGPLNCTGVSPCSVTAQTLFGQIPSGQSSSATNFLESVPFTIANNASGATVVGSGSFNVTAENVPVCRISANNANLGEYINTANLNGSGSIVLQCSIATAYRVTLQPNNAGSNSTGAGVMRNGSSNLNYQLYRPSSSVANATCAYTVTWGFSNFFNLTVSPANNPRLFNVCVRVPSGQNVTAGSYTDTVTATVNF